MYRTGVSLLFSTVPRQIEVLLPWWHEFQNSVAVETELLHSHPLMESHFHLLTVADCAKTGQIVQCASVVSDYDEIYWHIGQINELRLTLQRRLILFLWLVVSCWLSIRHIRLTLCSTTVRLLKKALIIINAAISWSNLRNCDRIVSYGYASHFLAYCSPCSC